MYIDVLEKCATFLDHPVQYRFMVLWYDIIILCHYCDDLYWWQLPSLPLQVIYYTRSCAVKVLHRVAVLHCSAAAFTQLSVAVTIILLKLAVLTSMAYVMRSIVCYRATLYYAVCAVIIWLSVCLPVPVCLSVCPPVTRRYCVNMAKYRMT